MTESVIAAAVELPASAPSSSEFFATNVDASDDKRSLTTRLPTAVLGVCVSFLSFADHLGFRAVAKRCRTAAKLVVATPRVVGFAASSGLGAGRLPPVVRRMRPCEFSARSPYLEFEVRRAFEHFAGSLVSVEFVALEPERIRYRDWLPALVHLRRLRVGGERTAAADVFCRGTKTARERRAHDAEFCCHPRAPLTDLTVPRLTQSDLERLFADDTRLERLELWNQHLGTDTTAETILLLDAISAHPLRHLHLSDETLRAAEMARLAARLPLLESATLVWSAVQRTNWYGHALPDAVGVPDVAVPVTLRRIRTRTADVLAVQQMCRQMRAGLRSLHLELAGGALHRVKVGRDLQALERLETLEIVCETARDGGFVGSASAFATCVAQLERRRLRVFRYATRRDARFVWPDALAPILERGALRCDETRWLRSPPPERDAAPGLHVLDLRYCYRIGPELQELLTRNVSPAPPSSSSNKSGDLIRAPHQTLRDFGIGVGAVDAVTPATAVATDGAEFQTRHLEAVTVLRLEAAPAYSEQQWAEFVATPAVRYVTVRTAPPDQWAATWRDRGVRVSIVPYVR